MNEWAEDTTLMNGTREKFSIGEENCYELGFPLVEDDISMDFETPEAATPWTEDNLFSWQEGSETIDIQDAFLDELSPDVDGDFSTDTITSPTSSAVCSETPSVPPKKKRGRRPNSERGLPLVKQRKPPKPRIYEIEKPFADKELEQKRQCAINAKKHRDMQKNVLRELREQIQATEVEKATLAMERANFTERLTQLAKQLETMKEYLVTQATTNVMVLETS